MTKKRELSEKDMFLSALLQSAERTKERHSGPDQWYTNSVEGKLSREWYFVFYSLGWKIDYLPDKGPRGGNLKTGRTKLSLLIEGKFDYRNLMLRYMAITWRENADVFNKNIRGMLKESAKRFFPFAIHEFRTSEQLIHALNWKPDEAREFERLEHEINTNRRKYE